MPTLSSEKWETGKLLANNHNKGIKKDYLSCGNESIYENRMMLKIFYHILDNHILAKDQSSMKP